MAYLQVLAVGACLGWMGVSSGLILVNKYIMSTDGFHYPMALSGLGMAFSSVASWLVCRVSALAAVIVPQNSGECAQGVSKCWPKDEEPGQFHGEQYIGLKDTNDRNHLQTFSDSLQKIGYLICVCCPFARAQPCPAQYEASSKPSVYCAGCCC